MQTALYNWCCKTPKFCVRSPLPMGINRCTALVMLWQMPGCHGCCCSLTNTIFGSLLLQDEFDVRKKHIKPAPTAASEGHALGAMRTITKTSSSSVGTLGSPKSPNSTAAGGWKMPKFEKKAQPKVTQYITGTPSSRVEQIHS